MRRLHSLKTHLKCHASPPKDPQIVAESMASSSLLNACRVSPVYVKCEYRERKRGHVHIKLKVAGCTGGSDMRLGSGYLSTISLGAYSLVVKVGMGSTFYSFAERKVYGTWSVLKGKIKIPTPPLYPKVPFLLNLLYFFCSLQVPSNAGLGEG